MPKKLRTYFQGVARSHKGGKLGISWPLPFKKFALSIKEGLHGDTPSYCLQEGVGEDYGFTNPEEDRGSYNLLLKQIGEKMTSDRGS